MAKGIIYVMTTVIPGIIKIGKTSNFKNRMLYLEHNGYGQLGGLKRYFAIEVDSYDEKENLLFNIFSKSRIKDSEFFALDVDLVVSLLSSFEGKQIYPEKTNKEDMFNSATKAVEDIVIPDGEYYLNENIKSWGNKCEATLQVKDGKFMVLKGATMSPIRGKGWKKKINSTDIRRQETTIRNNILQADESFTSVSSAAEFVTFMPENGWAVWKNSQGQPIDIYRNK